MNKLLMLLICLLVPLFSGCTRYYVNQNAQGRTFAQDTSYCRAVAYGQVPFQAPTLQGNRYATTQGNVLITDQYGNRTQGAYTANTQYYDDMANANNFMAMTSALGAENARNQIWAICMTRLGWREVTKEEQDAIMGRR
jgi:hypothetical protein